MPSRIDRTNGELDWPQWAERTPADDRDRTSKFSVTKTKAIKDIRRELEARLGVDDWRLSTASPHRKSDGLPYADHTPSDPGAVVRWSMDGDQYCIAADEYDDVRDNIRAIGLYVEEKRKMSNRPVHTGQDEFATARLPGGDDDVIVADDGVAVEDPYDVLGVTPDAPDSVVKAAADERIKETHPDNGGDSQEFQRVHEAREMVL